MKKTRQGVVLSNKMNKTVVVLIERRFKHPFYGKVINSRKKIKAHDENNKCVIGDVVTIEETRPISRDKCFKVVKILGKTEVKTKALPVQAKVSKEDQS